MHPLRVSALPGIASVDALYTGMAHLTPAQLRSGVIDAVNESMGAATDAFGNVGSDGDSDHCADSTSSKGAQPVLELPEIEPLLNPPRAAAGSTLVEKPTHAFVLHSSQRQTVDRVNNRFELKSSSFHTAVYDTMLSGGQWMYEVTLKSSGLMQIGWCPPHDVVEWAPRLGVGDFVHTIGYDGYRRAIWNIAKRAGNVGAQWVEGDVVGACIDLDRGRATFRLNGVEVWSGDVPCIATAKGPVPPEERAMYLCCPGLSLSKHEACSVNVGFAPFVYPDPAYRPVGWHSAPVPALYTADLCVEALCRGIEATTDHTKRTAMAAGILLGASPDTLLDLGVACVFALLRRAQSRTAAALALCQDLVDVTAEVLHGADAKNMWAPAVTELCHETSFLTFRVPSRSAGVDWAENALKLLDVIVVRNFMRTCSGVWPKAQSHIDDLMLLCRPRFGSDDILEELIPEVDLTTSAVTPELERHARDIGDDYYCRIFPLRVKVFELLARREPEALCTLMRRIGDGKDASVAAGGMLFTIVAHVINEHAATLNDVNQFAAHYCSASALQDPRNKLHTHRMGGRLSDLLRSRRVAPSQTSNNQLLDYAVWLLHVTTRRQIPELQRLVEDLLERHRSLQEGDGDFDSHIQHINSLTRILVLHRARMLHDVSMDVVFAFAANLLALVKKYESDPLFTLIPQAYVSCAAIILQVTRRSIPVTYSGYLAKHASITSAAMTLVMNPKIAATEAIEVSVQLLSLVLDPPSPDVPLHMNMLATIAQNGAKPVRELLRRMLEHMSHDVAWTLVVDALSRINSGNSLLSPRAELAPGATWLMCEGEPESIANAWPPHDPSKAHAVFAECLRELVRDEKFDATKAVRKLISRASWLSSELDAVAAEEIGQAGGATQSQRRRMGVIFDLLCRQMVTIEFVIEGAGDVLFTPQADGPAMPIVLQELVELVMQICNRYAAPDRDLRVIAERRASHGMDMSPWRMLAPVVGCLLLLGSSDTGTRTGALQQAFVSMLRSPRFSWSLDAVKAAVTLVDVGMLVQTKRATAPKHKVLALLGGEWMEPILTADTFVQSSASPRNDTGGASNSGTDDDDDALCAICAVDAVDCEFVPCKHRSCRSCIDRQLADAPVCFFCKATVERVAAFDPNAAAPRAE